MIWEIWLQITLSASSLSFHTFGGRKLQANKTDGNRPPFLFLYHIALPGGDLAFIQQTEPWRAGDSALWGVMVCRTPGLGAFPGLHLLLELRFYIVLVSLLLN